MRLLYALIIPLLLPLAPVQAQSLDLPCYMVTADLRVINLSGLCGGVRTAKSAAISQKPDPVLGNYRKELAEANKIQDPYESQMAQLNADSKLNLRLGYLDVVKKNAAKVKCLAAQKNQGVPYEQGSEKCKVSV